MKHTWSSEKHHWLVDFELRLVELTHVGEVKHVLLDKCLFDLFIRPVDEELVIKVCLLSESTAKINWIIKPRPIPISLKEYAQLLGSSKSEHRDQHFASFIQSRMDLLQELPFSGPFRVSDRRCIGSLRQHHVGPELVDPSSPEVSISCHIVVASVHECFTIALDVKHSSAKHVACIVSCDFHLSITKSDGLVKRDRADFVDTLLDHITVKTRLLFLLGHCNFAKVFEHQWEDGLGRCGGDDWSTVADCFCQVRQSATVI